MPFDPDRVLALRRLSDAVFKRPVRLGDTIHVEGEVRELRDLTEGAGLVTLVWRVLNQDGRSSAARCVEVLWRRDAAAPAVPDPFVPTEDGFVPIPL